MIYYLDSKKHLQEFQYSKSREMLLYPDQVDLRNYAFSIVYNDGACDEVVRNANLIYHYYALKQLYMLSQRYCSMVSHMPKCDHFFEDQELVMQNNMLFYNANSSLNEKYNFATLWLPNQLTETMKDYILKRKQFLLAFSNVYVFQYFKKENIVFDWGDYTEEALESFLRERKIL